MTTDMDERLHAVAELTKLFRAERLVHLVVTSLALAILLGSAVVLLYRQTAGAAELSGLFGSSGLITYTTGRLLKMWDQALSIVAGHIEKRDGRG